MNNTGSRPPRAGQPSSDMVLAGRNALREALSAEREIDKIFVKKGEKSPALTRLLDEAAGRRIPVLFVTSEKLCDLAGTSAHQGVVTVLSAAAYSDVETMLALAAERGEPPLLILCDGIEDPHNLGAVIRTAECAGAHGVIIPRRRAVGLTSVVAKASAGALARLPVARVANLAAALDDLRERGLWAYACDMGGAPCYSTDLRGPAVFVLGAEGAGISRLVREKCDFCVSVPLYGSVNSLNVSNAAAVILCEAARQRH